MSGLGRTCTVLYLFISLMFYALLKNISLIRWVSLHEGWGKPEYLGKPLTFVILAYTAPHWIALESLFCANHYIDILPKTFEMSTLIVPL